MHVTSDLQISILQVIKNWRSRRPGNEASPRPSKLWEQ